jgi:hypothetical protein
MKTWAPLIAGIVVAFALCSDVHAQSNPDFVIAVSDPEVAAPWLGGDDTSGFGGASYFGTLTSLNGYDRPVTLSCTNVDLNVIVGCSFGQAGTLTIVPSPSGTPFTLVITPACCPLAGDTTFSLQGIGADHTQHQLPLILHSFGFSVLGDVLGNYVIPTITVPAGSVSSAVSIAYVKFGTSARPPVMFYCGNLPAGVTCNEYPATSVLDTITTSVYTVSVASSTPPGTYSGNIGPRAQAVPPNASTLTRGERFTLVVQPASGLTADISVGSVQSDTVGPVAVGQPVTFTAQVNNSGPDAPDSTVSFVFYPSASIVSATAPQGCVIATNITCDVGQLASGTGATVSVTVQAPFTRTLSATAFASSNAVDTNLGNNVLGSNAVAIRLRPLVRKGLPAGQP